MEQQFTTKWTDEDIDAAYFLGIINSYAIKLDADEKMPSVVHVQKELDRLKSTGFETPSEAIKSLRYPEK